MTSFNPEKNVNQRSAGLIDIQGYHAKLANKEPISEGEIMALLKELEHYRGALAYMATCQAATLLGLPKSTSKSALGRHVSLCETAAELLRGNASRVTYSTDMDAARERRLRAARDRQGS